MQSNGEDEGGDGLNFENVRSIQLNPEENNEVNYKWICETCTYENWIAAKCCIMCRTKRHQMAQIFSENHVNQGSVGKLVARKLSTPTIAEAAHSDIFKLGTSGSPPPSVLSCSPPNICSSGTINSRSSSPASHYNNIAAYYIAQQHLHQSGAAAVSSCDGSGDQNEQHQLKWSCAQCTYLNLPKSPKCIQCLSSRKRISPAVSRNSPVSPRQAGSGGSNNFGDNSLPQTMVYGNNSTNNQHISHPSPPYRPQSTSPPPKTLHNLGTTLDSLRISSLEDPMSNNERNRNNSSPPHSQIQNRNMGIQDKKTQYQLQNKDKNIMLQNRVVSPPIISTVLPPSSASTPTSSSPRPLLLVLQWQKSGAVNLVHMKIGRSQKIA